MGRFPKDFTEEMVKIMADNSHPDHAAFFLCLFLAAIANTIYKHPALKPAVHLAATFLEGATSAIFYRPLWKLHSKSPVTSMKLWNVVLRGDGFAFLAGAFDFDDTPGAYAEKFEKCHPFIQDLLLAPGLQVIAQNGHTYERYMVSSMYLTKMGEVRYFVTRGHGAFRDLPVNLLFSASA